MAAEGKVGLFDFVGALSQSKKDLIAEDPENEREFNSFMVNQAFSQHLDTVLYANEMNVRHHLPKVMVHDFYLHAVPPRNRRGKWAKKVKKPEDVVLLAQHLRCSSARAAELLPLLSEADLARVRELSDTGGR